MLYCKWLYQKGTHPFFSLISCHLFFFSSIVHFLLFFSVPALKLARETGQRWLPSQLWILVRKYRSAHFSPQKHPGWEYKMSSKSQIAKIEKRVEDHWKLLPRCPWHTYVHGLLAQAQVISKCMYSGNRKTSPRNKFKCDSCSATKRLIALSCVISICSFFVVFHHLK